MLALTSVAMATAMVLALAAGPPKNDAGIEWLQDDWPRAKTQAIEAGQLVAIDVWGTWCHTCLSMKNYVLTSPLLRPVAKKHTYLTLDFDKPGNAAFLAKAAVNMVPTILVVDPKSETVVARWVGSGTAPQIATFLSSADAKSKDPLVLGYRALAKEDYLGAKKIFEAARQNEQLGKEGRTKSWVGWIEAMWKLDEKAACAREGVAHLGEVENTSSGIDYAAIVAKCAEALPEAEQKKTLLAVRDRLLPVLAAAKDVSVDDRSWLYAVLIRVYDTLGEKEQVQQIANARLAMLEEAATQATTPADRATFDAHRLEEYVRAKRWTDAEKMLLASANAQPQDFNPFFRLAVLYSKQGKTAEGLTAIDRALALGYGPRRLRLYAIKIELLMQNKSWAQARRTIGKAKAEISKMSPEIVRPSWIAELDAKSSAIDQAENNK